jgi:hypothetical protein
MPPAAAPLPTASIVVEWENARWADLARTRAMLGVLRGQLAELRPRFPAPPEVLFVHDRNRIDAAVIERCLAEAFADTAGLCQARLLPMAGLGYYGLKNAGAAAAAGEVLVFLDCDVIPEPGWLAAMVEPFADADMEMLGGQTFIGGGDFYSRAAALFWVFPLRRDGDGPVRARHVFANNCAFRRGLFLRHPYPPADLHRGNCRLLSRQLYALGVDIRLQLSARADHPPPAGFGQFLVRGIWRGHDDLMLDGEPGWRPLFAQAGKRLGRMHRRILGERRAVGLGRAGAIAAYAVGLAYNMLAFGGAGMAILAPRLLHRLVPK